MLGHSEPPPPHRAQVHALAHNACLNRDEPVERGLELVEFKLGRVQLLVIRLHGGVGICFCAFRWVQLAEGTFTSVLRLL